MAAAIYYAAFTARGLIIKRERFRPAVWRRRCARRFQWGNISRAPSDDPRTRWRHRHTSLFFSFHLGGEAIHHLFSAASRSDFCVNRPDKWSRRPLERKWKITSLECFSRFLLAERRAATSFCARPKLIPQQLKQICVFYEPLCSRNKKWPARSGQTRLMAVENSWCVTTEGKLDCKNVSKYVVPLRAIDDKVWLGLGASFGQSLVISRWRIFYREASHQCHLTSRGYSCGNGLQKIKLNLYLIVCI